MTDIPPPPPPDVLQRAIASLGSQAAMARLLGVAQPSVWKWLSARKPLPAQHVLRVEAATGISRHELRPDLYPIEEKAPADSVDCYMGARP